MSDDYDLKICCMGAGYVGGPTMAVIAKMCPKVSDSKMHDEMTQKKVDFIGGMLDRMNQSKHP